jgi:hypothetical protein
MLIKAAEADPAARVRIKRNDAPVPVGLSRAGKLAETILMRRAIAVPSLRGQQLLHESREDCA